LVKSFLARKFRLKEPLLGRDCILLSTTAMSKRRVNYNRGTVLCR